MESESNVYAPPKAPLEKIDSSMNTSGMGKGHPLPAGVQGWSWGAFLLNWIWAIGNQTWIGLLSLIPYIGFIFTFMLGIKGREWAWQNKRWDSLEHFNQVQKKWSVWGVVFVLAAIGIGILAAILIPMFQQANG